MKCPECGEDTNIVDSRPRDDRTKTYRRRKCPMCGCRFSTMEVCIDRRQKRVHAWETLDGQYIVQRN